jgi:hypothetical protein
VLKEKYILFQANFYRPSNAATSARLGAPSMPPNRVHDRTLRDARQRVPFIRMGQAQRYPFAWRATLTSPTRGTTRAN